MIISCQWLQNFVDLDVVGIDVEKLAKSLTMIGLNVDEIQEGDDNTVLNIEVTSNRPDCLSHLGVAREIAAHFRLELKQPDLSAPHDRGESVSKYSDSVSIEDPELCPRYAARIIRVAIGESPSWLRKHLEAVGQRPVNNVVDVTNYVMMELGHPLHAFDLEKLRGERIVVRIAKPEEYLITLDGLQRQLTPSMLMICDAERPIALAGIMGGQESEVSAESTTVLLESAYFRPSIIRATSKQLGLRTEASFRFERGADPEMPVKALNRACRLFQDLCDGVLVSPVTDEYPNPQPRRSLQLRSERIRKVTGLSMDPELITDILPRLEFKTSLKGEGLWDVQAPSFRVDIGVEDDLVEEVVRHYGYDRIQSNYPAAAGLGKFLPTHSHDRIIARTLQGFGFFEAIDYVFTNPAKETIFWNESPSMVRISNPLTDEDTHLRISLVPGLIETLRRNLNHGNEDVRLFELGKVFVPQNTGNTQGIQEISRLALVATGRFYEPFWKNWQDEFNFHHLKGIVDALIEDFDRELDYTADCDIEFLHPGIAAAAAVKNECLGVLGELHPRVAEAYRFRQPVLVAEFTLTPLYALPLPEPRYTNFGRFPSVQRDLSFLFDKEQGYSRILAAIEELGISELEDVRLVGFYLGSNLPQGKASLTMRLTFANPETTLTQDEVSRHTDAVLSVLHRRFGVEIRT